MMHRLLAIVISWGRPHFLLSTLQSLSDCLSTVPCDVVVVDNGSDDATRELIDAHVRPENSLLWGKNRGINCAVEAALDRWLTQSHRWILVSDADMKYQRPPHDAIDLLETEQGIGAVSFQHSPEHPVERLLLGKTGTWPLKRSERGCALLFRVETLQRCRPLPVLNLKDFDWWVCRDAPKSLQSQNEMIAVFVGGARHLAWRAGDSTWQSEEIPEFTEFRV